MSPHPSLDSKEQHQLQHNATGDPPADDNSLLAATAAPSLNHPDYSGLSPAVRHDIAKGNVIVVDWDGPDDPQNPMNWSLGKKWINTSLLCAMCLFIGLATAAYGSGVTRMCEELHACTSPPGCFFQHLLCSSTDLASLSSCRAWPRGFGCLQRCLFSRM